MTDQEHATAIREAVSALNDAIRNARSAKVFAFVSPIELQVAADAHPTVQVNVSVVKAI